jgi:two-component system OmpR family response regulator
MATQNIQPRILIVEDEPAIVEVVAAYLRDESFLVEHAEDGEVGAERALSDRFDLMLLDLNLPKLSGTEVFKRVRARSNLPIIMLTTKGEEIDRVVGLELGADDYISKPFSPRELVARVKSVLRRAGSAGASAGDWEQGGVQRIGTLEIDRVGHEVRRAGVRVAVTPMEFRILDLLARNVGRAFTRAQLLDKISEVGNDIFDRTLDRHVANLRRKIEDDPVRPSLILTVPGVGYKCGG